MTNKRIRAAKAPSTLLQNMTDKVATAANQPQIQAQPQQPQMSPEDARVQAMLNALGQQRNMTADSLVNMAGELAATQAQRDELRRIGQEIRALCVEACNLALTGTGEARIKAILAQVQPPAPAGGSAP